MLAPFLDLSLSDQHLSFKPPSLPKAHLCAFIDPATEMPSAPKLEESPLLGPFDSDQQLRPPIKLFDKADADAWNVQGMFSLSLSL